jgi:hypothetical protein
MDTPHPTYPITFTIYFVSYDRPQEPAGTGSFVVFQSTPPRGGRLRQATPRLISHCFNPRPRVGGDVLPSRSHQVQCSFNPRPRVGGDSLICLTWKPHPSFNPRPRVGGDRLCHYSTVTVHVSIHAPAWGATREQAGRGLRHRFQSTPPRGGRL